MADYSGLNFNSVFAGSEVSGARPTDPRLTRKRTPLPPLPSFSPQYARTTGGAYSGSQSNFDRYPSPGSAPLSFTGTPRSNSQNVFLQAIQGQYRANQPVRNNSLAQFVRESYAAQAPGRKSLDSDIAMIDKVFARDGGLAQELIDQRAKRKAGVLMAVRSAMNRANRENNLRRMFAGNNSYNDRMYADALGRTAAQSAVEDADLARSDALNLANIRSGLLGSRNRLRTDFTNSFLSPGLATNAFTRDDASVLSDLASLENQNSVYESPLDALRRKIAEREAQAQYEGLMFP